MDASELASIMLEYETLYRELQKLEAHISAAVMERGKTFVTGNVRATYMNPRRTYDYEDAVKVATGEQMIRHSKTVVDWRALCQEIGYEPPILKETEARVSIKVG